MGDKPLPAVASEIAPSAGFQPSDILLTKRHWGAFAGTDLEQQLKTRGIDTIVLTGISSNIRQGRREPRRSCGRGY
jgi:nicotinamidase-related amidase